MTPPTGDHSNRAVRRVLRAYLWGMTLADRGQQWLENRDPATHTGATIGWYRRYQAADGQLYAVLLSAYFFLTMFPAMLVETSYVTGKPAAFAVHAEHRLGLHDPTSTLFVSVFAGVSQHAFVAVLLAVLGLVSFGLGFGRVLQLVHARAWGIDLRKNAIIDQSRYLAVLLAMLVMSLGYLLQQKYLGGRAAWIGWLLDLGWLAILCGFFIWSPRLLLHHRIATRRLVPGAVFTVLGLIALRIASKFVLAQWLDSYSKTYGAVGIVMGIIFWLITAATILVLAAALSPALAHRRDLLDARHRTQQQQPQPHRYR